MKIQRLAAYAGPNIWCLRPVVAMDLALEDLDGRESREFAGFHERLLDLLPGLGQHHCSRGYPGGFVERLREGTWLGHVVEHVALELQVEAGYDVRFGRTRQLEGDNFRIIFEHGDEGVGEAAGRQAVALVEALLSGDPGRAAACREAVRKAAEELALGPSTRALYEAARQAGIPVRRLGGSLLELGHGIYRRRLWGTVADTSSAVAVDLAGHKHWTKERWNAWGLPVVEGSLASTPEEALQAFFRLGAPALVKPALGRQGRGVSGPVFSEAQLQEAVAVAAREGWPLLVERYVEGATFRILVVGGKARAAAQRLPPRVVGDGRRTVRQLVEEENGHPRRGEGHGRPLSRIPMDDQAFQALSTQGLTWDSVPARGQVVALRFTANLSTGGTARDVTDEIHPSLLRLAEEAALAVGLDIAGVDLLAPSAASSEGVLLEVNASPGLRMHLDPDEGRPRPVGVDIVRHVMGGGSGRIPIAAITGTNGKTTTARLLAHLWRQTGLTVGLAATGGVMIGEEVIWEGDTTGPESARRLLSDPRVEAAVLETARGGILRGGLAFDRCRLSLFTGIGRDHLGQEGIHTLRDLLWVKGLLADVVEDQGWLVLRDDDPLLAELEEGQRRRRRIGRFGLGDRPRRPLPDLYVGVKDGRLWVAEEGRSQGTLPLERLPLLGERPPAFQIRNVQGALAAALALGVPLEDALTGLMSFTPAMNRGRFQRFRWQGRTVLLDYGHNPDAWEEVFSHLKGEPLGQIWGVIGVPGDRGDDWIREAGATAARYCHRLVIKEDRDLRGRSRGEVAQLLVEGALRAGYPSSAITVLLAETEAFAWALHRSKPGDGVVLFYEELEPHLALLEGTAPSRPLSLSSPL